MDPETTPQDDPPTGVESDLDAPNDELPLQIALSTVCMFLCICSVALRLYTRRVIIKLFGFDDWALVLAAVGSVAFASVAIHSCVLGSGKHGWNVSRAKFRTINTLINVSAIIYSPTVFCAKYAVLHRIKSIFYDSRREKAAFRVIWALIWANLLMYTIVTLLILFGCRPLKRRWDYEIQGHCINSAHIYIATGLINMVSDFTILAVPLAAISKLHAPLRTKLFAASLFSVGIFACMASVVRFYYSTTFKTDDITWLILPINQWAIGEITTIVLVACLPDLPRLFKHIKEKMKPPREVLRGTPMYARRPPAVRNARHVRRGNSLEASTFDAGSIAMEDLPKTLSGSNQVRRQGSAHSDTGLVS